MFFIFSQTKKSEKHHFHLEEKERDEAAKI